MKNHFIIACAVATTLLGACASTADVLVNKEPGYYYGAAFAASEEQAATKALAALMRETLVRSGGIRDVPVSAFVVTDEIRAAFASLRLKPYKAEKVSESRYDVVYRLAEDDWEKVEAPRVAALESELGGAFAALLGDRAADTTARLVRACAIVAALERTGAELRIASPASNSPSRALMADAEAYCKELVASIAFSATPGDGLVPVGSSIALGATDGAGRPIAGLPVVASWSADGRDPVRERAALDARGVLGLRPPADLADAKAELSISIDAEALGPGSRTIARLGSARVASFAYRLAATPVAGAELVAVPGGELTIGAPERDRRAGRIEKARSASIVAFSIMPRLVTNAEYGVYLEAVDASFDEYPDYWEDPSLNAPEQPVIGLSLAEATAYAAWLGGITGLAYRLPSEAEFEAAARAGADAIYPWGDQAPSTGEYAAFAGNAKATAPVASYEAGRNALGLYDMAGNVWEWTGSLPEGSMSGDPSFHIVKGGSYLDGQYELRISNRQLRDPALRYPDVGFRLVSEVRHE